MMQWDSFDENPCKYKLKMAGNCFIHRAVLEFEWPAFTGYQMVGLGSTLGVRMMGRFWPFW